METENSAKIKCLIVDDEPLATKVIEEYVDKIPQLDLVATCTNPMNAFEILNSKEIDLLFLDIEMPGMNGLEFIRSISKRPDVIFTTAYREYAIESYEIDVVDYLLKPIEFSRFFKSINKYLNKQKKQVVSPVIQGQKNKGSIYIYADRKNVKVYFDEILYLESLKDYVRIVTTNKNLTTKDSITRYSEILPSDFIRVHRSYIVNFEHISAFTKHDIEIGEKEIPIGASYKRQVMSRLQK